MLHRVIALLLVAAATPALASDPEGEQVTRETEARKVSQDRPFFERVERIERASRSSSSLPETWW